MSRKNSKKAINYIYDFGDDWLHSIKPLAKPKEEVLFPLCIDGEGAAPVEDCGGLGGFYHMLEIFSSSKRSSEKGELRDGWGWKRVIPMKVSSDSKRTRSMRI